MTLLLTGATGFVGGQLLALLRGREADVRVVVRDAGKLGASRDLDVVEGDLDDRETLDRAMDGIECAFYLVHSMDSGEGGDFAERDRQLAQNFVDAADRAGVPKMVFLGGIVPPDNDSEHLESRHQVEEVLDGGEVDLVSLRASMIVGARSASFRTLVQIVDRLPVLPLPPWRRTRTQPVAIADVVAALGKACELDAGYYDIAGPDELSIEQMIDTIGELLGSSPTTVAVPVSSPGVESAGAAVVTDEHREVLRPLFAGLEEDLLVGDNRLEPVFGVTPTPFREAARQAIEEMRGGDEQLGETVVT